jgi:hypothetical protein
MIIRGCAVSVALLLSGQAHATEPGDLVGVWTTEWANSPTEPVGPGGPLTISRDSSEGSLDGHTPAAGFDGVMNGEVTPGPNGALIWEGRWASVWPEGATMGTFRLVFTDANTFTGTWATDDKQVRDAAWNGHRAP